MEDIAERVALVTDLVTLSRPIDEILADLARNPYDIDAELVTAERAHVIAVLKRFIAGEVDAETVETWADAVELRDDVGISESDQFLQDILFALANPDLTQPLSNPVAEMVIHQLSAPPPSA